MATPRAESLPKEALAKPVEGKKEEWVTVGHKGKASSTPLAPKYSFAKVTVVPPILPGVQSPVNLGTQMASKEPILGALHVSNPAGSQGIKAAARATTATMVLTPLTTSSIVLLMTRCSRSPPGHVEKPEVKW